MALKVNVYLKNMSRSAGRGVSPHVLAAAEGLKKHGLNPTLLKPGEAKPCDLSVCWGVKKRAEMRSGQRCLVLERAYIEDRFKWTSCGFDGLNGRADFCNENSPSDRWDQYFSHLLQPWRDPVGDYVLILGQVKGDASIRHVDIMKWYKETAQRLRNAGYRAAFRAHPKCRRHRDIRFSFVKNLPNGPLEQTMRRAKWVVTFNSNSGVDAVINGIPAVTVDEGAMAWDVTGHNPVEPPPRPDRTQWCYNMAYTQWSKEELANGDFWEHLKKGVGL